MTCFVASDLSTFLGRCTYGECTQKVKKQSPEKARECSAAVPRECHGRTACIPSESVSGIQGTPGTDSAAYECTFFRISSFLPIRWNSSGVTVPLGYSSVFSGWALFLAKREDSERTSSERYTFRLYWIQSRSCAPLG